MSSFSGERSIVNSTTITTASSNSMLTAAITGRRADCAGRMARTSVWFMNARSGGSLRSPQRGRGKNGLQLFICLLYGRWRHYPNVIMAIGSMHHFDLPLGDLGEVARRHLHERNPLTQPQRVIFRGMHRLAFRRRRPVGNPKPKPEQV